MAVAGPSTAKSRELSLCQSATHAQNTILKILTLNTFILLNQGKYKLWWLAKWRTPALASPHFNCLSVVPQSYTFLLSYFHCVTSPTARAVRMSHRHTRRCELNGARLLHVDTTLWIRQRSARRKRLFGAKTYAVRVTAVSLYCNTWRPDTSSQVQALLQSGMMNH